MKNLNELFKDHALRISRAEPQTIMRGMFFDCQGTLFDSSNQLRVPLVALMRASRALFKMPPYIISAHLPPFIPAIEAADLHHIATLQDKFSLQEELARSGKKLEFLIDDQPMFGIDAFTTTHPDFLLHLLAPEATPTGKLKPFMPAFPAP